MQTTKNRPQSTTWLVLGLTLGLLGVLASIFVPSREGAEDVRYVARVNGMPISRDKYLAYLQVVSSDRKDAISREDSEYVLQRMIEEELLVQRGVEVGMLESDRRTRAALVNAMISMTTAQAEAKAPGAEELETFFAANRDYFTPTARLRVRQWVVFGEGSEKAAREAYQRLINGEAFEQVSQDLGSPAALSVPDTLLPPVKLREYLGPTLTGELMDREGGYITPPQAIDGGYRITQLLEIEASETPRLDAVRDQVEAEYARRAGDRALREYLEWLRDRAEISYPSDLPL